MGPREELRRLGAGLGVWVWLPVLALLVVIFVVLSTPGADCDGSPDDLSGAEGLVLAVAALASLGALAGAAARISALLRDDLIDGRQIVATIAGLAGIALLSTFIDVGGSVAYLWSLDFAGIIVTGAALVALIGAWLLRRKPDQAGLLLPFYLLAAALFVYPGFALLAIGLKSGALC